ncbi:hypothetical protein BH23ACT5_BH23ACT5_14500 [soil metagenome]
MADSPDASHGPLLIRPDGGEIMGTEGRQDRFLIDSGATEGRFSLVEHTLGPRVLAAPMHKHTREDEYTFVLEGRVGAVLDGHEVYAEEGDLLFKPLGQWHTFWNAGDGVARMLEIISSGGLEELFRQLDSLPDWPPPERLVEMAERYGCGIDFEATFPFGGETQTGVLVAPRNPSRAAVEPTRVEDHRPPPWVLRIINPVLRSVLRSPFHRPFSRYLILLAVTGRRTGRRHLIPVGRHDDGEGFVVSVSGAWRYNLLDDAPVSVIVDGRERAGSTELETDPDRVSAAFRDLYERYGTKGASLIGLKVKGTRSPTADDIKPAVATRWIARIRLSADDGTDSTRHFP